LVPFIQDGARRPGGAAASIIAAELEVLIMARYYIDCRDYPSEANCTVALSADSKEELLEAAVQHASQVHGHQDSPELRDQMLKMFSEGETPAS
jgi:predicted small metal-binding protein